MKKRPKHYIHSDSPVGFVRAHFEDLHHPECCNEVHFTPDEARAIGRKLIEAAKLTLSPPKRGKKK